MTAGRFSSYLEQLREELYLRYGRTEGSWMVQQILLEVRGHLEDSFDELRNAGIDEPRAAHEAVARFGSANVVANAYSNLAVDRVPDAGTSRRSDASGDSAASARSHEPVGSNSSHPAHTPTSPSNPRAPRERLDRENMFSSLVREARFAVRGLLRTPGYALAFILTLGLGIGADTAIFSVVNGVLLQPLPYRDGHELMYLRQTAPLAGMDNALFSVPEIDDYRHGVEAFEEVAEFSALSFTLLGLDEPHLIRAGIVTGNYFDVMGFGTVHGRTIAPTDDGQVAAVMVLTHDFFMQLGGDPALVGRQVVLGETSVTIVGVADPVPPYPERTEVYVNLASSPHHLEATMQTDRLHRMTEVFARLAPAATLDDARVQIEQVEGRIHAAYPEVYVEGAGYATMVTPLARQLASRGETVFLLLLGAAGFVLLLACANVANLTLARALRRRHELVVRTSLGAGRAALRRQLLVEALVPSVLGALLGLGIARVMLDGLVRYAARYTARAGEIGIDTTVFAVTLAVAVGAACLFAFVPPLPSAGSAAGIRATRGIAGRGLQRGLVVAQVAVCFVLLIGAGLLLRTLMNLSSTDSGFELESVLTVRIPDTFGLRTTAESRLFQETLLERASGIPGVTAAALGSRLPLEGVPEGVGAFFTAIEFDVDGDPLEPGMPVRHADFRTVTPGYFDTVGMHVVAGRPFQATDTAEAPMAVIVNESFARQYFGERNPVGQRIKWQGTIVRFAGIDPGFRTVVGVVSDASEFGIGNPVPQVVFHPHGQMFGAEVLFLRTEQPASVARPAIDMIRDLDDRQPVLDVMTLAQVRDTSIAPQRLNAVLLGAFALLAVAIATVGVASVLAFSVSQRTREIGVRAALGADRARLVAAVVREGATMAAVGLAIGVLASMVLSRAATGLLYGVRATDATTYAGVAIFLLAISLLAAWYPARRAARIDPVTALRSD